MLLMIKKDIDPVINRDPLNAHESCVILSLWNLSVLLFLNLCFPIYLYAAPSFDCSNVNDVNSPLTDQSSLPLSPLLFTIIFGTYSPCSSILILASLVCKERNKKFKEWMVLSIKRHHFLSAQYLFRS